MAVKENPFPGMNPFMERRWSNMHLMMLSYMNEALAAELPDDLYIGAEESISVESDSQTPPGQIIPDVAVKESWKEGIPPTWQPESDEGGIAVAKPEIVYSEPETERWLEIRDLDENLVTAIELLSPANKNNPSRESYLKKQAQYLASHVNLVEIDLLRTGWHTVAVREDLLPEKEGTRYLVCVSRATQPYEREVYRCPLDEPIPAFRVPLRPTDKDVVLNLQPMIDRCYRTGGYWHLDFSEKLSPKPTAAEVEWIEEKLRTAELIS